MNKWDYIVIQTFFSFNTASSNDSYLILGLSVVFFSLAAFNLAILLLVVVYCSFCYDKRDSSDHPCT